ncbi:MAG: phenylalanine--tRNA ligase subunit alpha [Candidatus Calescibacterium sp.]|nr:phenylalanine--tRNA ligase subunit alpha [Candidatus Calescibacterium sp.]MCX7733462.1 phenylalanine--tRNA ligase subunit alpha [bacterium]MDW8087443.1 phenylalanine--tRNA ligase subunit alpha [Candidatus Calescibacterium sp.]
MKDAIDEAKKLKEEVIRKIEEATKTDSDEEKNKIISELKSKYLKEKLPEMFKIIPQTKEVEQKKLLGKILNEIKEIIETKSKEIEEQKKIEFKLPDITLDGRTRFLGATHPVSEVMRQIKKIFEKMGFEVEDGPEVEGDWYNFTALNIPPDHPARDMQDTFYLEDNRLLRTHTSPVQIRAMEKRRGKIPIKIIAPGRVFRRDWDATHSPVFHQVEGLYVDKKVRMSDLFGVLEFFFKKFFSEDVKVRFRPSYFPFTEPSAEVDVSCSICKGENKSCKVCKGSGFLEVAGCGMVHPEVFRSVQYTDVQGFAFGMGVERLTMIKYNIDDIRLLFGSNFTFFKRRYF